MPGIIFTPPLAISPAIIYTSWGFRLSFFPLLCLPSQEAWNEKVLALCSEDFWLLFLYFRTLAHKMAWKRKSSIEGFLRYGNPDCQILGTLKNKIQIHGFLSFLSNNTRSNFIFRVAWYLLIAKMAHIWDPWEWKFVWIIKNMLKISYTIQIFW